MGHASMCKVVRVSAMCEYYTPHTYAALQLLCDRFVFGFLHSWRSNFAHILISIVIIDGVQHQLYNPGYVVSC